jgi:hypothetical protein
VTGSKLDRVKSLLGEPLLLTGEDRAAYDDLLAAVTEAVQPTDVLEQIWTNEAVEKQWDALRQRRIKTAFIAACGQDALRQILGPLLSYGVWDSLESGEKAGTLAWKYTLGDDSAIKEVEELLNQAKLTKDAVHAQAMALHIDTFETFDRLIWAAESRRDVSLREIEHHRAPFGQSLRRAIAQVEAVEVRKLESPTDQKRAA